jgi:hypothetical protein
MLRGLLAIGLALLGVQLSQAAASAAPASDFGRVIERYGAPVREDSTANAPVALIGGCNESFLIIGSNGPWREIFSVVGLPDEETLDEDNDIFGWVLAEHMVIGGDPPPIDCAATMTYGAGRQVQSASDRGCLTLRSEASPAAGESECRPDGTRYEIVSGPSGGGDEWYEVHPMPDGPNGFARGRELLPVP